MSDNLNKPEYGDSMESFFDNLMSEKEATEFLAQRQQDHSFISQWELQKQIDASLKDLFHFELPLPADIEAVSEPVDLRSSLAQRRRMIQLVIAASLVGVLCWFFWGSFNDDNQEVVHQAQPLAMVYQQKVDAGFTPYYVCEDMERFAATFKHRHGVALTLTEMPDDNRMLGLSYLGAINIDDTAMLCTAQDQPVLVLIDNLENEPEQIPNSNDPNLNIFREEKFGLVFYEVTPFGKPIMIQYFELADELAEEADSSK